MGNRSSQDCRKGKEENEVSTLEYVPSQEEFHKELKIEEHKRIKEHQQIALFYCKFTDGMPVPIDAPVVSALVRASIDRMAFWRIAVYHTILTCSLL